MNIARLACPLALATIAVADRPFMIHVTDDQTRRGVPLVELRTLNESKYYTDSNGVVAITDPWLFGSDAYFRISSPGYEFLDRVEAKERGKVLRVTPGGRIELTIRRHNIAERLYRITGAGIYRDSVLAHLPVPVKQPMLNGKVVGQDTCVAIPYRGKIFWIWGDTFGPANMLFSVSAATSDMPGHGGLEPDQGVDLKYFVGEDGFTKAMLPIPRPGLVWIEGLLTVQDPAGRERLVATYTRQQGLGVADERGVAVFNDAQERFDVLARWAGGRAHQSSHPFRFAENGKAYWYLYPHERVPDDWRAIQDPRTYESYTCLKTGTAFNAKSPELDRQADGTLRCDWKAETDRINGDEEQEMIQRGLLPRERAMLSLLDVNTDKPSGTGLDSVAWNPYRARWIMIGNSFGSVYYSEADQPQGPWDQALKIADHGEYNFYNPVHHTFFDKDGGRIIYFEGTYTDAFTQAREKTPLYNYNQIMYRLRLDDSRIAKTFGPPRSGMRRHDP